MRNSERAAYQATIAHQRDQILWLRALVAPGVAVSQDVPVARSDDKDWEEWAVAAQGPALAPKTRASDDEDAINEMLKNEQIDTTEAEALLEAIGAQSTEIEFAS